MKREVYDSDGNQVVDQAEIAVPGAHTHGNADLTGVPGAGLDTSATAHAADVANPHGVTAVQAGADVAGSAAAAEANAIAASDPLGTSAAGDAAHLVDFDHTNIEAVDDVQSVLAAQVFA